MNSIITKTKIYNGERTKTKGPNQNTVKNLKFIKIFPETNIKNLPRAAGVPVLDVTPDVVVV